MVLLRFPQRAVAPKVDDPEPDDVATGVDGTGSEGESPPTNLRFLLTPDNDPALDYLDELPGLDILDDNEREARIAVARHTGS